MVIVAKVAQVCNLGGNMFPKLVCSGESKTLTESTPKSGVDSKIESKGVGNRVTRDNTPRLENFQVKGVEVDQNK